MENVNERDTDIEQGDDFAEGFDLGENDGQEEHFRDDHQQGIDEDRETPSPGKEDQPGERQQPEEDPTTHVPPPHPAPQPGRQPERTPPDEEPAATVKPKPVDVPEEIAIEFAELKKTSPKAAELALEDSPDGEAIRKRLEMMGSLAAEDTARQILFMREQAAVRRESERRQEQAAVKAHNDYFQSTLQREVPEYASMLVAAAGGDTAMLAKAVQKQQEIFAWIASKPYAEAAPLMEVAKNGRDPNQIAALIKQFESERKAQPAAKPDPTGALAVPARGAPSVPAGVGDKDDFDAGWNANPSK